MTVWISLIVGGLIIAATLGMAGYWLFRITHKASPPPRHDGAAGNTGNGPSDAPNQGSTKPGNGNKGNNRPSSNATGEESVSAVSETEPPSNRISMVLQRLMADVSGLVQGVRSKALAYDDQLESHQRELETGLEKSDPHALCRTLVAELTSIKAVNAQYRRDLDAVQQQLHDQQALMKQVHFEANTDFLTNLPNRRMLDRRMEEEIERAKRYDQPLSVVMIDADRFKRVNDDLGHAVGDKALRLIAHVLDVHSRPADTAGRYGGEEFLLILPHTSLLQALNAAERVRRVIQDGARTIRRVPAGRR